MEKLGPTMTTLWIQDRGTCFQVSQILSSHGSRIHLVGVNSGVLDLARIVNVANG